MSRRRYIRASALRFRVVQRPDDLLHAKLDADTLAVLSTGITGLAIRVRLHGRAFNPIRTKWAISAKRRRLYLRTVKRGDTVIAWCEPDGWSLVHRWKRTRSGRDEGRCRAAVRSSRS